MSKEFIPVKTNDIPLSFIESKNSLIPTPKTRRAENEDVRASLAAMNGVGVEDVIIVNNPDGSTTILPKKIVIIPREIS